MTQIKSEQHLLEPVRKYLSNTGFKKLASEVQFHDYRIDVFGYDPVREVSVAVELKLVKWSSAINQAMVYQLCADKVYIAMPRAFVHRVDLELLSRINIGLLSVNEDRSVSVCLEPGFSTHVRSYYRVQEVQLLERSKNGKP